MESVQLSRESLLKILPLLEVLASRGFPARLDVSRGERDSLDYSISASMPGQLDISTLGELSALAASNHCSFGIADGRLSFKLNGS